MCFIYGKFYKSGVYLYTSELIYNLELFKIILQLIIFFEISIEKIINFSYTNLYHCVSSVL